MKRKKLPASVEVVILRNSRRRCAICYFLHGDLQVKKGQIAHVNRNHSDDREDNLCFLCRRHADEYDTRSHQSKGFTPAELRAHRSALYDLTCTQPELVLASGETLPHASKRRRTPDLAALYSRRLAVYNTTKSFLADVVRKIAVTQEEASKYATEVDEAFFLFDDSVAAYLFEIYRKAIRLRYLEAQLQRLEDGPKRFDMGEEEATLFIWFGDQFDVLRAKLVPFMRV